jgi:PAS domain S-box-containing protein
MHSPPLDYRTLFLASGIVAATSLTLHTIQARKLYPGFARIVAAIDLLTVAIVVADLRGYVPDALLLIQVAAICAFAWIDNGIRLFCGSPPRGRWPYAYVATAIILQTLLALTQPLYIRIFASSLLLIPVFIDASRPLLRTPPAGCRFGYRFTAAVLMFGCVIACVRMVAIFYLREQSSPYFSAHPANTLFFFLIMFQLIALAFGFIALAHERLVSELEFANERFRLLYENAPLGVTMIDQSGHLTSANQQFAEISGYSPEATVGFDVADLAAPEDRATAKESVEALLSRKIPVDDREMRLSRKDGSTTWVRLTATVMRANPGKPQWGIVAFQDISKRKQAEEALRQSEERFTEKLQEYLAIRQKTPSD